MVFLQTLIQMAPYDISFLPIVLSSFLRAVHWIWASQSRQTLQFQVNEPATWQLAFHHVHKLAKTRGSGNGPLPIQPQNELPCNQYDIPVLLCNVEFNKKPALSLQHRAVGFICNRTCPIQNPLASRSQNNFLLFTLRVNFQWMSCFLCIDQQCRPW